MVPFDFMARPTTINRKNLTALLRAKAPISATELAAVMGVNLLDHPQ